MPLTLLPRILLTALNVAVAAAGVYYVYFAQQLSEKSSANPCLRQTVSSIQWTGVIGLTLAAVGITGAWFKLRALLSLYIWAVLMSTAASAVFFVFVWAMMPQLTAEKAYASTAEHGVWLSEYKPTLQRALANDKDMFAVRECLNEMDFCRTTANQTQATKVDFIHVGCCFPPKRCGLEQTSSGRWVAPKGGVKSADNECRMWAREGESWFDCDSCKAAYLANFQGQWEKRMRTHIMCILMLMITSGVAYYTYLEDYGSVDNKVSNHERLMRTQV